MFTRQRGSQQVFGLMGARDIKIAFLVADASQLKKASAKVDVRSQLPLRGSSGFAPDSILICFERTQYTVCFSNRATKYSANF